MNYCYGKGVQKSVNRSFTQRVLSTVMIFIVLGFSPTCLPFCNDFDSTVVIVRGELHNLTIHRGHLHSAVHRGVCVCVHVFASILPCLYCNH